MSKRVSYKTIAARFAATRRDRLLAKKRAIRKCRVVDPAGVRTASNHRTCCERSERSERFELSFPPLVAITSRIGGPYGVFEEFQGGAAGVRTARSLAYSFTAQVQFSLCVAGVPVESDPLTAYLSQGVHPVFPVFSLNIVGGHGRQFSFSRVKPAGHTHLVEFQSLTKPSLH